MRANPGGEIAPNEVVGRDRLIRELWQTLEQQSVILVAERRMGKSCVIKKMVAERPENILAFYRDVENIDTPIGFVERIYQDVSKHLSATKRTTQIVHDFLTQLGGAQISGVGKFPEIAASHWKTLLEGTIEDLISNQEEPVLLFWDEFPLMLQKIARSSGEETAMDILDTLRSLRQTHSRLRMLYTGSIGLHHVITALKEVGHNNDATNDMRIVEVQPLTEADAQHLALCLLEGEELECSNTEETAREIALLVDRIAFYIHYVVSELKYRGDAADIELARKIVSDALVEPQDPWHLQHYRERLDEYYGQDLLPIVLNMLDELTVEANALSFDELNSRLAACLSPEENDIVKKILSGDRELLRRIIMSLQRDHYVECRSEDGYYRFRFPLIQRWWRITRSLP